jgi:hypothetical protein
VKVVSAAAQHLVVDRNERVVRGKRARGAFAMHEKLLYTAAD